jgi:hypothetical protein
MEAISVTETMMESAACEALGANTAGESAAYQRQVADDGTGELRKLDRELRQTAARLAAASPHMMPPADLRGRIVQATAPVTFKMEDYRRATREDYRFYKWGFYAAALFLIAGAWYNIDAGAKLQQANQNIVALQQQGRQVIQQQNEVIATLARGNPITLGGNGQTFGKAVVDFNSHKAVLIFPEETMPLGSRPQLNLTMNNEKIAFDTRLITAPAVELGYAVVKNATNMTRNVNLQNLKPDETQKPMNADIMAGP